MRILYFGLRLQEAEDHVICNLTLLPLSISLGSNLIFGMCLGFPGLFSLNFFSARVPVLSEPNLRGDVSLVGSFFENLPPPQNFY